MTAPAIIRKTDLLRAAKVSNSTGCKIEIKSGDTIIVVHPEEKPDAIIRNGLDYSRPIL